MKEKIILAIKAKHPKVNLSKTRLAALATRIETKIDGDEAKIDDTITSYEEYIVDIAKADDAARTLEAKLKEKGEEKPGDKKEDPAPPDDTPAYIKAMMAKLDTVTGELAAIKGEKAQQTIKGEASKLLKDVPASYWIKRPMPEKMEDLDAFVTEVSADYTAFKQEWADQGLNAMSAARPGGGQGGAQASKDISPDIKAFVESKQKAQAQAK
jgi:hypothetical protein